MRLVHFEKGGIPGIAADDGAGWHGLTARESGFPGTLPELIAQGADLLRAGKDLLPKAAIDLDAVRILPPVPGPSKIICVGLNYDDHLAESGLKKPVYPEIFARFATSLIAHGEPILRPPESSTLDYEAELAVVIGRGGRRIGRDHALDHVAGYSLFNDATIREFQLRTPQWTMGKNFDATGAFGPWLVTPDAVPPGASGLRAAPTPPGVPVMITSPGSSVIATLISSIKVATLKISWSVRASCITLPLRRPWMRNPPAPDGTASGVTSQGPNAPVASKFLPIVH